MSEPTFARPLIMTRTLLLATALGSVCYALATWSGRPTFEPLLLSLLAGIILRSLLGDRFATPQEAVRVSHWLLFPGIVCYALANLNLATIAELPPRALILLCTSLVVAFAVIFLLGRRCGQRLEITSLVATGSAICGASAIVVTAPAVRARACAWRSSSPRRSSRSRPTASVSGGVVACSRVRCASSGAWCQRSSGPSTTVGGFSASPPPSSST